jgi:hypothetical protein
MERASGFELGLERDRGGRLNLSLGAPPDAHGRRAGGGRGQGRYSPTPAPGPAGGLRVATVADHIHGWNNVNEFWLGPLQSLCTTCHSGRKQSIDRLGFDKTVDTSGWPIDKNHPVYTGVVE